MPKVNYYFETVAITTKDFGDAPFFAVLFIGKSNTEQIEAAAFQSFDDLIADTQYAQDALAVALNSISVFHPAFLPLRDVVQPGLAAVLTFLRASERIQGKVLPKW